MHGSGRPHDAAERDPSRSTVTWTDLALLVLPVVCMVVAFVVGNGLFDS
jgi:hypothetical protein